MKNHQLLRSEDREAPHSRYLPSLWLVVAVIHAPLLILCYLLGRFSVSRSYYTQHNDPRVLARQDILHDSSSAGFDTTSDGTAKETKSRQQSWQNLPPVEVLTAYTEMHSTEQLRKECPVLLAHGSNNNRQSQIDLAKECPDLLNRRFAVGFYSCPFQAGIQLHHFFNNMAWAIATNRTLLFKYYDLPTYLEHLDAWLSEIVNPNYECHGNSRGIQKTCEETLSIANWIPSYDEWVPLLGYNITEVSFWSTHLPPNYHSDDDSDYKKHEMSTRKPWNASTDTRALGIDQNNKAPLVHFGRLLHQDFCEELSGINDTALIRLLIVANDDALAKTTIALHSRHPKDKDDGSNVEPERNCLKKLLHDAPRPCTVYLLVLDRPKTISAISTTVVQEWNCSVATIHHQHSNYNTTTSSSYRKEHGPFARTGFFRDLALASKARHGLIGRKERSSTMLLEELIVFHNVISEQGRGVSSDDSGDDRPYASCNFLN